MDEIYYPYTPQFEDLKLQEIANECGLIIDPLNVESTTKEIEFL